MCACLKTCNFKPPSSTDHDYGISKNSVAAYRYTKDLKKEKAKSAIMNTNMKQGINQPLEDFQALFI